MSAAKKSMIGDVSAQIANPVHNARNFAARQPGDIDTRQTFAEAAASLLGKGATVSQTMGISDLDLKEGFSHTTTGIPYAIHGTATLVQQQVAHALASYQDPIKAILGTAVHRDRRIVIRRKFVVGGQAMITPERAPARTVAIKEDERQVVLARYGGDLEMNLNLFLRPEEAAEEFNMKLDAQKRMLEQQLCHLGYEMLMREGTQLVQAMIRSSPATKDMSLAQRQLKADRLYVHTVFGAMNKNPYPLESLLASAKAANLYTPGAPHGYSTMIIPNGMFEMHRYTKPEELVYNLSGVKGPDRKPIQLTMDRALVDTRTGMKLLVHTGFPDMALRGTPYAMNGGKGLSQKKYVGVYYPTPPAGSNGQLRIANLVTGAWEALTEPKVRVYEVVTSSAIMAVPGADTGELLYAYPSTGISTSQTTESMKMQLRVYLGSVLYDPNKILILPDVHLDGVTQFWDFAVADKPEAESTGGDDKKYPGKDTAHVTTKADLYKDDTPLRFNRGESKITYAADAPQSKFRYVNVNTNELPIQNVPMLFYQGRVQNKSDETQSKWVDACLNRGHFGALDDPDVMAMHGGYAYNRNVKP